jgi:5-methylcytosine-specific restriction endonuclease McrA
MRKPTKSSLRNKADALLQKYIREKHNGELCWRCGEKYVTVGHHFIYKAQSNSCRYYLPNIIPLCRDCHRYAHTWQNLFAKQMALKLGQSWSDDIDAVAKQKEKFTLDWIQTKLEILETLKKEGKCIGTES